MNITDPVIYGFIYFIIFIILNIVIDIGNCMMNKIHSYRFFKPDFILNHIDHDKSAICSLLNIKPFFLKFFLKGYFLLNREQILALATFLEIHPNSIYKFNIFDSD